MEYYIFIVISSFLLSALCFIQFVILDYKEDLNLVLTFLLGICGIVTLCSFSAATRISYFSCALTVVGILNIKYAIANRGKLRVLYTIVGIIVSVVAVAEIVAACKGGILL